MTITVAAARTFFLGVHLLFFNNKNIRSARSQKGYVTLLLGRASYLDDGAIYSLKENYFEGKDYFYHCLRAILVSKTSKQLEQITLELQNISNFMKNRETVQRILFEKNLLRLKKINNTDFFRLIDQNLTSNRPPCFDLRPMAIHTINLKKMNDHCQMSGYTKTGKVKKHAICNTHTFIMKPSCNTAKFRSSTKVNLCPVLNKTSNNLEKIYPVYNDDGKGHLPAFILEADINYYRTYEQRYKREHETKIQEDGEEKTNMFEPMPIRKNKYCGVCKDDYDDYLSHISTPQHKASLKKNRFTNYINRMCDDESKVWKSSADYLDALAKACSTETTTPTTVAGEPVLP